MRACWAGEKAVSRLLRCEPVPALCRSLSTSAEFWRILDAMGIKDEYLLSERSQDEDARPRSFAEGGIRVERGDEFYIIFVRPVLSEQDIKLDENTTKKYSVGSGADPEQSAGDGVMAAVGTTSGPCLNALCRWLQLYGWTPSDELQQRLATPAPPA